MNRLRYSVSLSYEVMDPMADFVLNIEATRTSRQFVVAERLTFPPSIQTTHYMDPVLCNRLPKGRLPVRYEAVVDIDHRLDDSDQLSEVPVAELPFDVWHTWRLADIVNLTA